MKRVFVLISLIILPISMHAQEKYFHELRGMEDSTGTTHLFYRYNYSNYQDCSYTDNNDSTFFYNIELDRNDLRRLDTSTQIDTLFFSEGERMWFECSITYSLLQQYDFAFGDINRAYLVHSSDAGWTIPGLQYKSDYLGIGWVGGTFHFDYERQKILIPIYFSPIVIKAWDEPEFGDYTLEADLFAHDWDSINSRETEFDSTFKEWIIAGINPSANNEYLAFKRDSIFISEDHGDSFSFLLSDSTIFNSYEEVYESSRYTIPDQIEFKTESGLFFSIHKYRSKYSFTRYSIHRYVELDSTWVKEPIWEGNNMAAFSFDETNSSVLFIADSNAIYISQDFGETFQEYYLLDHNVTGLYKKPDSDLLYISTINQLIELNTSTLQQKILKEFLVTSEPNHIVPTKLVLHQNYPNPFNPSTVISYQLAVNSRVVLKVYDLLGREVAELVNTQQAAGSHEVTFDASALSSGMYLYRIEANGAVQTKRFTLIK